MHSMPSFPRGSVELAAEGEGLPIDVDVQTSRLCIASGQACDLLAECAVRPAGQTCSRAVAGGRAARPPRAGSHLPAPGGPHEAERTAHQGWITKRRAARFEPHGRRLGNLPCP